MRSLIDVDVKVKILENNRREISVNLLSNNFQLFLLLDSVLSLKEEKLLVIFVQSRCKIRDNEIVVMVTNPVLHIICDSTEIIVRVSDVREVLID